MKKGGRRCEAFGAFLYTLKPWTFCAQPAVSMKHLLILLIRLYRRVISPLKAPSCRFQPTCSQYAIEALQKHGLVKGIFLSIRRILRCNPFCAGGSDPVP